MRQRAVPIRRPELRNLDSSQDRETAAEVLSEGGSYRWTVCLDHLPRGATLGNTASSHPLHPYPVLPGVISSQLDVKCPKCGLYSSQDSKSALCIMAPQTPRGSSADLFLVSIPSPSPAFLPLVYCHCFVEFI